MQYIHMFKYWLLFNTLLVSTAYGTLAGGRLNAFSEGQNAFAGVINPANAVWVPDRVDVGAYWVHQKSTINNKDNRPAFLPGKTDLTYHAKNILTGDIAGHKHVSLCNHDCSFSLAYYSTPTVVQLRTKEPIPALGTTPFKVDNKTDVLSAVFSCKLSEAHSLGIAIDYLMFSHRRDGFQNADNPIRSVSPGHVTNRGFDHSGGFGGSVGWRWNITDRLKFGTAWTRKSFCGRYRKYRGYEPHHAKNYNPQIIGGGFSYRFTNHIAGRLEMIWTNLGNLPNANSNVLPNGQLNLHKRGSKKSPGPGLQDATFINLGLGYRWNDMFSTGAGFSHRIKLRQKRSNILSHTYVMQTIYNTLSLGATCNYEKHNLFLGFTYGFKNRVSGERPPQAGGGQFIGERQTASLSFSWGYLY
jgi:long-chain fatty acid transport protein